MIYVDLCHSLIFSLITIPGAELLANIKECTVSKCPWLYGPYIGAYELEPKGSGNFVWSNDNSSVDSSLLLANNDPPIDNSACLTIITSHVLFEPETGPVVAPLAEVDCVTGMHGLGLIQSLCELLPK